MTDTKPEHTSGGIVSWVTPEWLAAHRGQAGLIIVDCRQNTHAYFTAHIPGAIHVHEALFRMHTGRIPVRWIPAELSQVLFRTLGFEQDSTIVVYSEGRLKEGPATVPGDGMEAAFVAYSLARFGCRRVMILDGGLEQWRAEGRPLAQDFGECLPSGFTVEMPVNLFIAYDEFIRRKDHDDVILLDTRPAAWYEGPGPWRRPGHIPGAVSLPAASLMDQDNSTLLKPEAEIRTILTDLGITPDKKIICSCGTGRTAVSVFLILKWFLGYPDILMFEGGFTEWVAHAKNPTVTGTEPR